MYYTGYNPFCCQVRIKIGYPEATRVSWAYAALLRTGRAGQAIHSKIVYNYHMDEEAFRAQLAGLPLPAIRWYPLIDSTNTAAREWANRGAEDGSLVAADQQSAGRGRLNRQWVTHPGGALAFSLILRPTMPERERIELFSPLGALGVASALEGLGLAPEIKCPNDVLLNHLKVSGILVESAWLDQELDVLILGIGVNVAASSVPPPERLLFPATCVDEVLGRAVERMPLMREILRSILSWRSHLGSVEFVDAWRSRLAFIGEKVFVSRPGNEPLSGVLLGVDPRGGLNLLLEDGEVTTVLVGDVSLRPHK